jgi:hypothetical protein
MSENSRAQERTPNTKPDNAKDNGKPQAAAYEGNSPDTTTSFDWVTARSSCSLPKVFNALAEQVEGDVAARNALRPANSPYEFSLTEDNGKLTVHLNTEKLRRSVSFKLSLPEHAIVVEDETGNRMFDIASCLDDSGQCTLLVNGEERDDWQVRRMALEELMFSGL